MSKIVSNYELLDELGRGGMGVVYKARHIHFDEIYAVKRLWEQFGANEMVLNLFLNEAKILRKLNHKNIVHVTDVFSLENQNYIVMEYIKGRSLDEIIKKEVGPIRRERAINLFKQMLEGIAYIHNQPTPIIHRDIKPLNLLVTEDDTVKITDFGIAKVLDTGQNASTVVKGTPVYMSPEQIIDPKSVDIRTDVYSLGMTFYEMLCAKTPFSGDTTTTPTAVYAAIMNGEVPPPTEFYPGISDALSDFVMKAIHKDRNQRFANANEMLLALDSLEREGETTDQGIPNPVPPVIKKPEPVKPTYKETKKPEPKPEPLPETKIEPVRTKSSHTWKWIAGFVVLLGIILFITSTNGKKPAPPATDTVKEETPENTISLEQQKEMVLVEGGTFQMGSNDGESDEKPVHDVTVGSFMIGKTELTLGSFAEFINSTNYRTDADKDGGSYIWTGGDGMEKKSGVNWICDTKGNKRPDSEKPHPVINVSWNDAVAYCNWLSEKEGLQKAYSGSGDNITCDFNANGYRLPTEAEWEYAARGGNKSKGYKYSGSNDIDGVAWNGAYDKSGNRTKDQGTSDVGRKQPNELGIYDMSGNVWEWCWDWKGDYSSGSQTNPRGPSSGSNRLIRGGGWFFRAVNCRVAVRGSSDPAVRNSALGFRVVRTKN